MTLSQPLAVTRGRGKIQNRQKPGKLTNDFALVRKVVLMDLLTDRPFNDPEPQPSPWAPKLRPSPVASRRLCRPSGPDDAW